MRKSNYDKSPYTTIEGILLKGWRPIIQELLEVKKSKPKNQVWVIECYQGVYHEELIREFKTLLPDTFIDTQSLFKTSHDIEFMTHRYLTDDRLFGYRANLLYKDFLDMEKVLLCKKSIEHKQGFTLIYGHAAAGILPNPDVLIYVDMARWEIQMRSRRKEINGIGVKNQNDTPSLHYKRGYFIDWNVCDALKKKILPKVDYWIDTHLSHNPKMIDGETLKRGLEKTVHSPFRVVPFFDPAPWGGQWMKNVCDLDKKQVNFGWCFDCVPEENSLYLNVSGDLFEMPSNNLVFYKTKDLLGTPVEARFGQDFPIRFDFLDTIGGGNLSLQVHPTTQYIRDTFGIYYTQDESYYMLDTDEKAYVYLGIKNGINPDEMIADLNKAQQNKTIFDVDKYINKWQAKSHDHFLIPAGTVHCSGAGAMVLEISATPSIFTFKLWDWERLGLDGLPRPINIAHGKEVIQWDRQTEFTRKYLINKIQQVAQGEGWQEERTGLHETQFIESRRHWFTGIVPHHTQESVNVLNLIEGDEAIVESPENAFTPFIVHYAETFIIPACVGKYTIRPYGHSEGKRCGTIKAYVRFKT